MYSESNLNEAQIPPNIIQPHGILADCFELDSL